MTTTTVTPTDLAREFSRILNEWCQPGEMDEIRRRNAERCSTPSQFSSCCASHDFYDANQAMLDALESLGLEWQGSDDPLYPLMNEAWGIAKAAGFDVEKIKEDAE